MKTFSFEERLAFSKGQRQGSDIETIRRMIDGAVEVQKTDGELDRQGIDYVVTLRGGRRVFVDAKARDANISRYWKNGEPELALEIWNVMPGGRFKVPELRAKAGWTLSESSLAELILFTFDPRDHEHAYLIAAQPLRIAFRRHLRRWYESYKVAVQPNRDWESQCVLVPINVVWAAIKAEGAAPLVKPSLFDCEGLPLVELMRRWREMDGVVLPDQDEEVWP